MDWKDKKVFITGADGFIGCWIAKTLVEKNAQIVVLMRDVKAKSALDVHKIRDQVTIVHGDLLDFSLLQRVVNEYEIEYVFHLAAQAIVPVANQSPMSTFDTNIRGTWTLLEAVRTANSKALKAVVVASSDKSYGKPLTLPYTEDHPLHGIYPYDASKACADILARCYATTYGLPIVVTRKANIYGGGDMNLSRIVPDAIRSAIEGKELVVRSDGTPERDFIYVKDAVRGYLLLAEHIDTVKGEAFNFGAGQPISVKDLLQKIIALSGKEIRLNILGQAKGEIDRQYLGARKVQERIGWQPEYTLDDGLRETIEWYKRYWGEK